MPRPNGRGIVASVRLPHFMAVPTDLPYGPGAPTEAEVRLLGPPAGKRVLVLGCTEPAWPAALAEQDAKVVTVEPSIERLDAARALADAGGVKVELHNVDFADLAFVRADTIDAAVAVRSLADVDDLDRVFRQVHRVLRSQGPLVLSLPHPAAALADGRSWFERPLADVFTSLTRTSFGVDVLLEPVPAPGARLPTMLLVRGRKLGL
jgi:SAM-dependent methyltransferase